MRTVQDLRDELSTRATEIDDRATDLLPGVRHKVRRTRQVRVATAAGTVAALGALAVVVLPGALTSSPDPAGKPPADYTRNGITLPGDYQGHQLLKGWAGAVGESRMAFTWTPTTKNLAYYPMCSAPRSTEPRRYWVRVNGRTAITGECNTRLNTPDRGPQHLADDLWWNGVPMNKSAQVTMDLVDEAGGLVTEPGAQLALGIYRLPTDLPSAPPTDPADYVKDGARFGQQVGGDRLAAATVGDPGQNQLTVNYRSNGGRIVLRPFSTAGHFSFESKDRVRIDFGAAGRLDLPAGGSLDPTFNRGVAFADGGKPGELVTATVSLISENGRRLSIPGAQLGLGIYYQGKQRVIGDGVMLDERLVYGGRTYQLADVRTADATKPEPLRLATPAGTPYLVASGNTPLGDADALGVLTGSGGFEQQTIIPIGGVQHTERQSGPAGSVSLAITTGKPTKGKLILALYLPV